MVIGGYLHIARETIDGSHAAQSALENIGVAAQRAARLTKQLLLFSRNAPRETKRFNLNESVENILKMLKRLIGENITITSNLSREELWISGDEGKIDQVIMNVVLNARDALPEGGHIEIHTDFDRRGDEEFILCRIRDDGIGMDSETIKHVFDPFYTTKSKEMGTGLGMAVVYGIVQEHEGSIEIDSAPGRGTAVLIRIPAHNEQSGTVEERTDVRPVRPTSVRRILLVEDEAAVMDVVASGLTRAGYDVIATKTLADAVKAWRESADPFDAVVADVVLPDGSGVALLELLSPVGSTQFVFASGYLEDSEEFSLLRNGGYQFLHKPYEISALRHVLEKGTT